MSRWGRFLIPVVLVVGLRPAAAHDLASFGAAADATVDAAIKSGPTRLLKDLLELMKLPPFPVVPEIAAGITEVGAALAREGVEMEVGGAWRFFVEAIAAEAKLAAIAEMEVVAGKLVGPALEAAKHSPEFAALFKKHFEGRMYDLLTSPTIARRLSATLHRLAPEIARRLVALGATASASSIGRFFRAGVVALGVDALLRLLDVMLAYEVFKIVYTPVSDRTRAVLKEADLADALDQQAADSQAFNLLMDRLLWSVKTGKLKLIEGVKLADTWEILLGNLAWRRPPYEGIFEPRKAMDFTGPWKGSIVLMGVSGPTNIPLGASAQAPQEPITIVDGMGNIVTLPNMIESDLGQAPPPLPVNPGNLEITQDGYFVTLRFHASKISGFTYGDEIVILDTPVDAGNITWAQLRFYRPEERARMGADLVLLITQRNAQGGLVNRMARLRRAG